MVGVDVEFVCSVPTAQFILREDLIRRLPSPNERVDKHYITMLARKLEFLASALEGKAPVKMIVKSREGRPWVAAIAKSRERLVREFLKPFSEEINPYTSRFYIPTPLVLEVGVKGASVRRYFIISEGGVGELTMEEAIKLAPVITPLSFSEFIENAKPMPSEILERFRELDELSRTLDFSEPGELPEKLRELARMLQEQLS